MLVVTVPRILQFLLIFIMAINRWILNYSDLYFDLLFVIFFSSVESMLFFCEIFNRIRENNIFKHCLQF